MRINFLKFLYSIIIITGISLKKLFAQKITSDTTKLLAAVSKKEFDFKSKIKEANVVFPESLEDSKVQSLSYIEKFLDKKRDFLLSTYETGKKFFPKIITVLQQYQLPEELKVLIALESGFNGEAVSKAGAVGYWQLMDRLAKSYGLQIASSNTNVRAKSKIKDDRKNLNKSTLAVAKYFRDQQLSLKGDLLLMVASYNCGIGNLRSAIRKCHKPTPGFWDIKEFLPKETKNFVMNFIMLNVIFNNYENFVNRQMLFAPTIINIPFQSSDYTSLPVTPPDVD